MRKASSFPHFAISYSFTYFFFPFSLLRPVSASIVKDLLIPPKNSSLERARLQATDRLSVAQRAAKREQLRQSYLPSPLTYVVELSSPFFTVPSPEFTLVDTKPAVSRSDSAQTLDGKDAKEGAASGANSANRDEKTSVSRPGTRPTDNSSSSSPSSSFSSTSSSSATAAGTPADKAGADKGEKANRLPISFAPKGPGSYHCDVALRSAYDTRVYSIDFEVSSQGLNAALDFAAPARQRITQDIPIVNSTDTDWHIASSFSAAQYFSGSREITVRANSTASYPLTFAPAWICHVEGKLVLLNTNTSEKYSYDLVGVGEEPLAEDHIIIECKARTTVEKVLSIENYEKSEDARFTVESDLPNVSGDPVMLVRAGRKSDYLLKVSPQVGGVYRGSITFTQVNGRFQWFAVEVCSHCSLRLSFCLFSLSSTLLLLISIDSLSFLIFHRFPLSFSSHL